jgi:iron complex outermembrane receptor protein
MNTSTRSFASLCLVFVLGAGLTPTKVAAQAVDLTQLSLEDLVSREVTSVAKKPQRVNETAAAVFVISQDDIRRSGATTIPELLRMAPGMEVAQLPSGGAAVSARGFNGFKANKLLVLVDGRAIYSGDFGGVFWDTQLVPVEDIQRIEVVRGPGATLWGANAVNGVVNIVTKHAIDTLGAFATAEVDDRGDQRLMARFGAQIGASTTFRIDASSHDLHDKLQALGGDVDDAAGAWQVGFRLDSELSDLDVVTLQGDDQKGKNRLTAGSALVRLPPDFDLSGLPLGNRFTGANVIARWVRTYNDRSGFALQIYWDDAFRDLLDTSFDRDELDLDFSHHFDLDSRNAIIWGASFHRNWYAQTSRRSDITISPNSGSTDVFSGFVEDDIALIPGRLTVSVGTKLEHEGQTTAEWQPSMRAIWRGGEHWSVWGAASVAVRTPSVVETTQGFYTPQLVLTPTKNIASEDAISYELGLRTEIRRGVALDLTAYFTTYRDLLSWSAAGFTPQGVQIVRYGNNGDGQSAGLEFALDAAITPTWTVKAAGDLMDLHIEPRGVDTVASGNSIDDNASPRGQSSIRSLWNVSDSVDLDVWYRYVAKLRTGSIPAYTDLSLQLAWRPTARLQLSLIGRNLLSAQRIEIRDPFEPLPAEVARELLVKISTRF